MRKSLPKNLVALSHFSSPVRYHAVCMIAVSIDVPMVSGTNRKW